MLDHGGKRKGAGRPAVLVKRVVGSISLLPNEWARLKVLSKSVGSSRWISARINEVATKDCQSGQDAGE